LNDSAKDKGDQGLPVRDQDAALATAGGNADLMRELFATFLHGIGPHWEELRSLYRAKNWNGLSDSAHRLHGSAAYCGVPALKSTVKKLEMAAEAGDLKGIEAGIDALAHEIERLRLFAADN
jgi:two-component system sensor histidine kinase BarA